MTDQVANWLGEFFELNPDTKYTDDTEEPQHKLNLFNTVLPAIDRQDKFFYRNLTEEEQDSIEPWILMRWVASSESDKDQPHYVLSINDFVNSNFSLLSPLKSIGKKGHKELQWMLLAMCGTGKTPRRKFIHPGKGIKKNKLEAELLKFYPTLNDEELALMLSINDTADMTEFFKANGYDDKTIKELLKVNAKTK